MYHVWCCLAPCVATLSYYYYKTCYEQDVRCPTITTLCQQNRVDLSSSKLMANNKSRNLYGIWTGILLWFNMISDVLPIPCINIVVDFMITSSNGNIFGVTGPLCGDFTGHRWIPPPPPTPTPPPHKGRWHAALIFSMICAKTKGE